MHVLNYYSIAHFFLWLLVARWIGIHWLTFLVLSVGWELLELVLPFEFAVESIGNKSADIIVNIIGFSLGLWSRKMPGPDRANSDRSWISGKSPAQQL